jgi:hypothetical protein
LNGKGGHILWPFGIYITAILYILCPFGNFVAIWFIFPRFGILCQENSGNPGLFSPKHSKALAYFEHKKQHPKALYV